MINLRVGDEACDKACADIYAKLAENETEVMYDDRDERAGVKFSDMDLIASVATHRRTTWPEENGVVEGMEEPKRPASATRCLSMRRCRVSRARLPVFSAFERLMAFRYLRAKRQEGFISVVAWFSLLGIMLGVATLIIVMSVMNGFRAELLGRILGLNGHLEISAPRGNLGNYDEIAKKIKTLPGVRTALPVVEGQLLLSANKVSIGGIARGMRAEDIRAKTLLFDGIRAGSLDGFDTGSGVMIGKPDGTPFSSSRWRQADIYRAPRHNNRFWYDATDEGLPRRRDLRCRNVGVRFEFRIHADQGGSRLLSAKGRRFTYRSHGGERRENRWHSAEIYKQTGPTVWIRDWRQVNSSFFTALQVERNVMFLILTLIILVAAFNIISSQVMLVNDKGKGIAILRTIGATRGMILRIFFVTGASVGVIGTILGVRSVLRSS